MSINSKTRRDAKKKKNKKKQIIITKSKSKNPKNIEFICTSCKTREFIPRDIVEYLDDLDSDGVDISVPPKFDCKFCNGKMEPIYYVGVTGHIYEYKEI